MKGKFASYPLGYPKILEKRSGQSVTLQVDLTPPPPSFEGKGEIEAPAVIVVEAKKTDLKLGFGQCIAEMVAVQRFNEAQGQPISIVYGSVSNGNQWQFLKLEDLTLTIDLTVYPLPPIEALLGDLVWMAQVNPTPDPIDESTD